ncbi:PrpR N-terminal domain-containing protein [Lachnospiraceae bacterium 62-35]
MGKIVLLVSREEMLYQAHNILQEQQFKIEGMKVIRTEDAVTEARHAIRDGAEIIIARGLQASLIKQYTDIPVVEIVMTAQEMALLVMKAKQIVKKPHPVIGVIGTKNMFCDMSYFDMLYDIELRTYYEKWGKNFRRAAERAIEDKVDLIIGGNTAIGVAEENKTPSLFLSMTEDAMRSAFIMAEHIDYAMETEKRNAAQIETLLDYSSNGVMRLDGQGAVISANPMMEQIMNQGERELSGRPLWEIFPEISEAALKGVMEKGEENCSWFLQAGQTAVLATLAPVVVDGCAEGAVFTCYRMKKRPETGKEIRTNRKEKKALIALGDFCDILQRSPKMQECIRKARLYSLSERPVVIRGEAGTEIQLLAQGIHNTSLRSSGPFLAVSCMGMDREEQKHWIFGENGAVSMVNGGTLFLEDGEFLSMDSQYRLYQIIRRRIMLSDSFIHKEHVDIRVILGTSRPLNSLAEQGIFRKDLCYLLEGLTLEVPPLRERKEDLKEKISLCLDGACERYSRYHVLTEGGWKCLLEYPWPGNSLQVESFAERLVLTAGKRSLDEGSVGELLDELYSSPVEEWGARARERPSYSTLALCKEAEEIQAALEKYGGSREKTAACLGISKSTLWRKMKKYRIKGEK